jgi:hypothetical protein
VPLIVAPNSLPRSWAAPEVNSPTFLGSVRAAASPVCEEKNWPMHEPSVGATASADEAGRSTPSAVTNAHGQDSRAHTPWSTASITMSAGQTI